MLSSHEMDLMYTQEQVDVMNADRAVRLEIGGLLQDGLDMLAANDITPEMLIRYVGQVAKDLLAA